MPSYVTLVKWTDQGIRTVKDAPKRVENFEAAVKAAGGRLKDLYLVMGEYDLVVITEAPNDEAVMRLALATGMLGNVRTTTMRAFGRDDALKIIQSLP
ncbi:MAG: GYD domain-containing protein [Candidatus Rokubacteria bacterium]|nr:GYD domain-containing protein [Candidatus Rokubacteria bacterium]